jgi:hypothetical protein
MTYARPEVRKVAPAARSGQACATTGGGTGRRLTGAAAWFPDTTTLHVGLTRDGLMACDHGSRARSALELPDGPPRWGTKGLLMS